MELSKVYQGISAGGPNARFLLYDHFAAEVNRLVWHLLGADPEHDDIVQLIFCSLIANMHTVREPEALRGWVRSVAIKSVRSELRKRLLRRRFFSHEELHDSQGAAVDDHEAKELLDRLYTLLGRLPPDERIVFALRYVGDHSLDEISEMVGMSRTTAKRRMARAEKRFRILLGGESGLAERLAAGSRWRSR